MLFVSLGAWCQVAYQLKTHRNDSFVASSFDWLVLPLHSIKKIFETSGEFFCKDIFIGEPSMSVECSGYGVLYHHEYERDAQKVAIITNEQTEKAQSKLRYKHKKMLKTLNSSGQRVTFVRYGGHALPARAWPYSRDVAAVMCEDLNAIVGSIEAAMPAIDFQLLFVQDRHVMPYEISRMELDPRTAIFDIPYPEKRTWMGDSGDWGALLNRYLDASWNGHASRAQSVI